MSAPALTRPGAPAPAATAPAATPRWRDRLWERRLSLLVLAGLLLVSGLVQGIGMDRSPQPIDDEGTYTAQAWAVFHLHQLTHYTYWYDHPPLGWLQLAGYAQLTDAFGRAPYAVAAGREFMLVVQLVSVVLLWTLARRVGLPRWGAAIAVLVFSLSPIATQFHREVYLDNIATPWLLAAFVLALTPRQRLLAFASAGLCFAVAVLTKETSLLLLPVFGWVMWRTSKGDTRRYAIAVSAAVFALAAVFYVLFAALKGEVLPRPGRDSLATGVFYQLFTRPSSGDVFRSGTLGHTTVMMWLRLDVVLPIAAGLAGVLATAVRRLRPFAAGFLLLVALIVRPGGYLPVPYVILLLPLAALLVAGVIVAGWEQPATLGLLRLRPLAALTAVTAVAAAAVAAPGYYEKERGFAGADLDQPMAQAVSWMRDNLPKDQPILTDDALWVDLVSSGFPRPDVVWFYKPDTDPAVASGWQNYDWVVSTNSVRTFPTSSDTLTTALRMSTPVATFGTGGEQVQIRQVQHSATYATDQRQQLAVRTEAGRALAGNPSLALPAGARTALRDGDVDARLLTVLAAAAAGRRLDVADLPEVPGEISTPRRTVLISEVNGEPVSATSAPTTVLRRMLAAQPTPYRPIIQLTGTGASARLVLVFPLAP